MNKFVVANPFLLPCSPWYFYNWNWN